MSVPTTAMRESSVVSISVIYLFISNGINDHMEALNMPLSWSLQRIEEGWGGSIINIVLLLLLVLYAKEDKTEDHLKTSEEKYLVLRW